MLSIKTIGSIGSKFMASDKDVSFVSFPMDFVTLVYYGQGLSHFTDMIGTHDNSHPIMLLFDQGERGKGKLFPLLCCSLKKAAGNINICLCSPP